MVGTATATQIRKLSGKSASFFKNSNGGKEGRWVSLALNALFFFKNSNEERRDELELERRDGVFPGEVGFLE